MGSFDTLNECEPPYKIWLQVDDDPITWCVDHINESDTEYRRVSGRKGFALPADLLEAAMEGGDDTKERLAAYAHEAWSGWMAYLFSKCQGVDGGVLIPQSLVDRWKRQSETPYAELPEGEKASDRKEAAVMLEIVSKAPQKLSIAVSRDESFVSILGVKRSQAEADEVCRKWIEICDSTDVEEWTIGEEAELPRD